MKKILLLASFLFVACSSAEFAPSKEGQVFASRHKPAEIEVFRDQSPAKSFDEIGGASACCSFDSNKMTELLKEKAAENGGDAILQLEPNEDGGMTATVIRYRHLP